MFTKGSLIVLVCVFGLSFISAEKKEGTACKGKGPYSERTGICRLPGDCAEGFDSIGHCCGGLTCCEETCNPKLDCAHRGGKYTCSTVCRGNRVEDLTGCCSSEGGNKKKCCLTVL